jgi:hypothetical protein
MHVVRRDPRRSGTSACTSTGTKIEARIRGPGVPASPRYSQQHLLGGTAHRLEAGEAWENRGECYFIRRLKIIMVPPSRSTCHKRCGVSRGNIGHEVWNVPCIVLWPRFVTSVTSHKCIVYHSRRLRMYVCVICYKSVRVWVRRAPANGSCHVRLDKRAAVWPDRVVQQQPWHQ